MSRAFANSLLLLKGELSVASLRALLRLFLFLISIFLLFLESSANEILIIIRKGFLKIYD